MGKSKRPEKIPPSTNRPMALQMDQEPYPGPNVVFHIRILILFIILSFTDLVMLAFAAESIVTHGVGGIVLFGSEVSPPQVGVG